jgi:hypothetical protein
MPGKTKRKFTGESMRLNKNLKQPLNSIKEILPFDYNADSFIEGFKKYYPFLWIELEDRYNHYTAKDLFLKKCGKEIRYKPLKARDYLLKLPQLMQWLSSVAKENHQRKFNEEERLKKVIKLENKRKLANDKRNAVITQNTETIQDIEPFFIDVFISAYHQRGISIEGKIEIFNELKKYNNEKTIEFFYKLNDAERNDQIRNMAFSHLQSLGKYVKLRKNFKGKKKNYMTEKKSFNMTPLNLLERIENNTIQNIKRFNFFLSHSIKNRNKVLEVIKQLNENNYSVYCDWTSDNDFLKRELISDYTKTVLKKRLEQSEKLLLLSTEDSMKSEWVEFELQYFHNLDKPIFYILIDDYKDDRLLNYHQLEFEN